MIYFLQAKGDPAGPVKIGMTAGGYSGVVRRLNDLQVGYPHELAVVALMQGGRRDERRLHLELEEWHLRGEWFRCEGRVVALVQEHAKNVEPLRTRSWEPPVVVPQGSQGGRVVVVCKQCGRHVPRERLRKHQRICHGAPDETFAYCRSCDALVRDTDRDKHLRDEHGLPIKSLAAAWPFYEPAEKRRTPAK